MITIFTPTYNRKNKLDNLYKSILNQNYNDLEWLIVDDGSTDGTDKYIEKIQKDNKININYIKKENGGKMSAVNIAHDEARGECFITIDSDDELFPKILDKIIIDYQKIKDKEEIAGIVYNASYQKDKGNIIGDRLPEDGTICKYTDLSIKYNISGDKATLWKTKVLRNYKFPIIKGEKFLPDLYLMMMISKKYNIMTNNKSIMLVEYQESGYTNNYFNLVRNNPVGTSIYFRELYNFDPKLYNIYGYILFSIYSKKPFNRIVKDHSAKLKVIVLYFPTLIISKIKDRKR